MSPRPVAALGLIGLFLLAGFAAGCDEDEPEGPPPALMDDARAMQQIVADDLVVLSLEEVEAAVDDELPVRAASLLERGAIPGARRHREALEAFEPSTPEGRQLKERGEEALRQRSEALEAYREVLARGLVEDDLALLDAVRAQRAAEDEVLAFMNALDSVLGVAEEGAPEEPVHDRARH